MRATPLLTPGRVLRMLGPGVIMGTGLRPPIHLLVVSGLINGVAAAPFMALALLVGQDRDLMRDHPIGLPARTVGWIATGVMAVAGVIGIVTL